MAEAPKYEKPRLSYQNSDSTSTHARGDDVTEVVEEKTPFEKYIGLKPVIALGLTIGVAWEGVALTFQTVFVNGGPPALIYGMMVCTIGSSATAASLGEMAAVDPAVGAQYRWTARYAPKKLRPHFWGFMQGWLTFVAWVAACASSPFSIALLIQSMVILNFPSYIPHRWHTTLIGIASILIPIMWNFWARRILVALEVVAGLSHFILFLVFVIVLGVLVPRGSDAFVWEDVLSAQPADYTGVEFGWTDPGVAFCVGFLTPALCVAGFDGVLHMSAETKDAPRSVPRAMFMTVLINGVLALCFSIALMYTLGDITVTLDASSGWLPITGVLLSATGSRAATTALIALMTAIFIFGSFNIFASVSRLTWSFARDGGLPFSNFFSRVHPELKIPVNALCLVAFLCSALLLVNIGSTVAFYAILSLATFGLFISYTIPLTFLLLRKFHGDGPRGSWQLGVFGIPINIFALCYCIFLVVWIPFPISLPVTGDTMNYASPIWAGCMILALLDYIVSGRKRFKLPVDQSGQYM